MPATSRASLVARDLFSVALAFREAGSIGIKPCNEVFADRTYQDDGSLTPRSEPHALIDDPRIAVRQVLQMIRGGTVQTVNGKIIPIIAETICIHSDGNHAVEFAKSIHSVILSEN